METLRHIYNSLWKEKNNKERIDMLLEPLQSMIQLSVLSCCPVGTKLSITNNILVIQEPTWKQGMIRNYNADKKTDLIYLFWVIKRYHSFYSSYIENKKYKPLFYLLIQMSKKGIDKLIQTYSNMDDIHLTQTLRLYRALLDKPDAFKVGYITDSENEQSVDELDKIFEKITQLYDEKHIVIVYNTLLLLQENSDDYHIYIKSIEYLMTNVNQNIRKWISQHIIL